MRPNLAVAACAFVALAVTVAPGRETDTRDAQYILKRLREFVLVSDAVYAGKVDASVLRVETGRVDNATVRLGFASFRVMETIKGLETNSITVEYVMDIVEPGDAWWSGPNTIQFQPGEEYLLFLRKNAGGSDPFLPVQSRLYPSESFYRLAELNKTVRRLESFSKDCEVELRGEVGAGEQDWEIIESYEVLKRMTSWNGRLRKDGLRFLKNWTAEVVRQAQYWADKGQARRDDSCPPK